MLEWVALPFFRGSSQPRDQTHILLHLLNCRQILYCGTTLKFVQVCHLGIRSGVLLNFLRSQIHNSIEMSDCQSEAWWAFKACEWAQAEMGFCRLGKEPSLWVPPESPWFGCVVQLQSYLSCFPLHFWWVFGCCLMQCMFIMLSIAFLFNSLLFQKKWEWL